MDRTSISILLNSSKHDQLPPQANPLKNLRRESKLRDDEQLKTKHIFPRLFDNSFAVSVLPVPTGPSIEEP